MPEGGERATTGRLAPACVAILLGAAILTLAVPQLGAALWLALRDDEAARIHSQEPLTEAELRGLIASREVALGWVDDGGAHADVAAALAVLAALREPGSPAERRLLERAVRETRAALARAPADPRGWLRLAYFATLLDGRGARRAAEALRMSVRTGPYDTPAFLALRLNLALFHWPRFEDDAAERRRIEAQIRLLWREAPGELAALALDRPGHLAVIDAALADLPGARQRLIAMLRETVQEVRPAAPGA